MAQFLLLQKLSLAMNKVHSIANVFICLCPVSSILYIGSYNVIICFKGYLCFIVVPSEVLVISYCLIAAYLV